jgi:hypothetical protein
MSHNQRTSGAKVGTITLQAFKLRVATEPNSDVIATATPGLCSAVEIRKRLRNGGRLVWAVWPGGLM